MWHPCTMKSNSPVLLCLEPSFAMQSQSHHVLHLHVVHAIGDEPRGQDLPVGAPRPHTLHDVGCQLHPTFHGSSHVLHDLVHVVHVVDVPNSTIPPPSTHAQTSTMAKVELPAVHLVVLPMSAAVSPEGLVSPGVLLTCSIGVNIAVVGVLGVGV